MKNYDTKLITKETEILETITCDFCKKSTDYNLGLTKDPAIETVGIHWGYGSKFDNEYWEFDICEDCALEKFGKQKRTYGEV